MSESPSPAELIAEGRALVRSLALRIYRSIPVRVELDDLIAYGELGLAQAARDFDPSRGNQFSTFAYYRIQGEIYDGLAKMTWTSRARFRRMRYLSMAEDVLNNERDQDSSAKSTSENGNWFAKVAEKLAVVYLVCDGDDEANPIDLALDPSPPVPKTLMHLEVSSKLRSIVEKLPLQERRLIQLVYFEGYALQDAGLQIGISKSWASRMHGKILERLAADLRRHDLHD